VCQPPITSEGVCSLLERAVASSPSEADHSAGEELLGAVGGEPAPGTSAASVVVDLDTLEVAGDWLEVELYSLDRFLPREDPIYTAADRVNTDLAVSRLEREVSALHNLVEELEEDTEEDLYS
jgi:hypothetical protein